MNGQCTVAYASTFKSKKGDVYTKLFVPISGDLYPVVVAGDHTDKVSLTLPCRIYVRDGLLKLAIDV